MKQLVMTVVLITLVAVATATATRAQSADTSRVNIPFDFAVGNQTLPAGEYLVRRSIERAQVVVQLRGAEDTHGLYLRIHPIQAMKIQSESKLVFNRYGNQYFLAEVWTSGRSLGEGLSKSTRERVAQREFAKIKAKSEPVALAMK